MKNNLLLMTNLLIHQKLHNICPLIPTQLNNFPVGFFVFLNGTIARKILLESLANSLNVQIVRQTRHGGDTLATVTLLDAHVHFIGLVSGFCVVRVLERVFLVDMVRIVCLFVWEWNRLV